MSEVFAKKSLTTEEQLNLLKDRGLIVDNEEGALQKLSRIGYYRLSSYMRFFQYGDKHLFKSGTKFSDLINLYDFDSELRNITFGAITKIEISYRAAISNVMCKKYGSHWFFDGKNFKEKTDKITCKEINFVECCKNIILKEIKKNDEEYAETFIANYFKKYNKPDLPPFWMIAETFTIGSLNKLFQILNSQNKKEIIRYLGFSRDVSFIGFSNWLFALCVVRNICAHHSRLFNRIFRISPTKHKKIRCFISAENNRFYYIAMIIDYYLKTLLNDYSFENSVKSLFEKYRNIDKQALGFPLNWTGFDIRFI